MGVKHTDAERRLEFAGLTPELCRTLRDQKNVLETALQSALGEFYQHLLSWKETAEILEGHDLQRLKAAQANHWAQIFAGDMGEDYVERAIAIGEAHERVGLSPRWYIASYGLIQAKLTHALIDALHTKPKLLKDAVEAIGKALILDIELAVTSYIERAHERRAEDLRAAAKNLDASVRKTLHELGNESDTVKGSAHRLTKALADASQLASEAAQAADTSSEAVSTNASAVEELDTAIGEISELSSGTRQSAGNAMEKAHAARDAITKLTEAAETIGSSVGMITDIARQTNMLSLNATIEAARAGESGKGFAVVAQEVRTLANQTDTAAKEISSQVQAIHTAGDETRTALKTLDELVNEINESSESVAAALEEQRATGQEISRASNRAAEQTRELSSQANKTAEISDQAYVDTEWLTSSAEIMDTTARRLQSDVNTVLDQLREQADADPTKARALAEKAHQEESMKNAA
jgi:methyl-accepting chemotaxis protein